MVDSCLGEFCAGERMNGSGGGHERRSLASSWKVADADDRVLADALQEIWPGLGGSAFGEAGVEGGFCAGVGEEQVFDDLLNAPFIRTRWRTELRLASIKAAE